MIGRFLAPVAALALLWAPFLPGVDADDHRLYLDLRPPILPLLLIAGLAVLALARRRLPRVPSALIAFLLVLAAVLQLVAALVLSFMERPLDLYFDPRHLPSLFGLVVDSTGPWRAGLVFAGVGLALLILAAATAWAVGTVAKAVAPRRIALAGLVLPLVLMAVSVGAEMMPRDEDEEASSPINLAGGGVLVDQTERVYRAWAVFSGRDRRYAAALGTPELPPRPLPGLGGQDVYLIFFESYGTIVLDDPRYRAAVTPALDDFAATVGRAGYHLVSSRLVSPTFGGGSWLAHGTIDSGIKLDPFLDELVLSSHRLSLPRYLAAAGYDTVEVMPGIKKPSPEAAFWGFRKSSYAADLAYPGPPFGWFTIPDQFTLRSFTERELTPGHAPLFAQMVLVSSHTPFAPVPPYVADWTNAATFDGIPQAQWDKIYHDPDWAHLDGPYLDSVAYDLKTLSAWLARLDNKALVIILGDHQPPGFVSGTKVPWTVPIHVLSRDPALVAPFRRAGYVDGAFPPAGAAPEGMERFLGEFLAFFSAGAPPQAAAATESPKRATP